MRVKNYFKNPTVLFSKSLFKVSTLVWITGGMRILTKEDKRRRLWNVYWIF